jgi:hypothetical protein
MPGTFCFSGVSLAFLCRSIATVNSGTLVRLDESRGGRDGVLRNVTENLPGE